MSAAKIRLSKSFVDSSEIESVGQVIERSYLGMGDEVRAFEDDLKTFFHEPSLEIIAVNSGTSALHLACSALDLGPGDEVIVPSLTFIATFQAVSATGAKPVPCDVLGDSVFINLKDAESRLTPRTKAIVPVHYASDSSRIPAVYEFAERHNLRVVEDAAHAFGTVRSGHRIGCEGDILCFSFDGIKNITCGEGGAITTRDRALAERLRDARLLGVEKDTDARFQGRRSWEFDVKQQGFRFHMSNIMAAIGRVQLQKFEMMAERRKILQRSYMEKLADIRAIQFLELDYDSLVPHIMVIKVPEKQRDRLRLFLDEAGIETGVHYKPNHLLSLYASDYPLPASELLGRTLLSLPIHPGLTVTNVDFITKQICRFFQEQS